jgi:hypothetical protein
LPQVVVRGDGRRQTENNNEPAGEEGSDPVFLALEISGNLTPWISPDGRAIDFAVPGGGLNVLRYSELEVFDATGRELRSWMALYPGATSLEIRLLFDDSDAVYPVTVDPLTTAPAWTGEGDQEGAGFGHGVASAGDVNGDGYDDVIVGAPYFDGGQTDEGRAYLFHGSASGLEAEPAWVVESNRAGILFGYAVAGAGDINSDGWDDVIVGAPHYSNGEFQEGAAWVYFGSGLGLATEPAWQVESDVAGALFGFAVAGAGDVNSDGRDDLLVGAPGGGSAGQGAAYVYHGSGAGPLSTAAWVAEGDGAGDRFGHSVSTAGDVNGDGWDDIIVGAPLYDGGEADEGAAYAFHGSGTGLAESAAWMQQSDQAGAHYGWAVSAAGDVNADSYDDVI